MSTSLENQTQKRPFVFLTALCTVMYFMCYVTRLNLSACMVEMVHVGFAPQETVALALSVCSVTYALGQILSGYLGDRLKPQNVILCGFLLTGAMNLSVGFLQNPGILVALWAVNGFAQALMWPPMLAILAKYLSNDEYSRACVWVGWGSAGGTIAVYAGTPLIISLLDYHWVFLICGAGGLLMALAFPFQPAMMQTLTLASLPLAWIGINLLAILLCVLGGYPIRRMWPTILLFPLFMASWIPLQLVALFVPVRQWHPIDHTGQASAKELSETNA